ncbi:MAG TPA: plastocyanin/azurin family copper-binding protein [Gaiellales bacterium]|nr:plastocyanin/azurin family copper-binding protein [Gaiellales bacterium]
MRTFVPVAALAAAALLAVPASAGTRTIHVGDTWFGKPGNVTVTVRKGTKVTWLWVGHKPHTVTVSRGPQKFSSPVYGPPGSRYTHRMTRRGTYKIYCQVHPSAMRMTLKVT